MTLTEDDDDKMLFFMYFLNTTKMILETVMNISWKSIYHQLTFAVPLTIHPVASGCAELFPTYISITIKKFLIQKLEKMVLGDLRHVKLRRDNGFTYPI